MEHLHILDGEGSGKPKECKGDVTRTLRPTPSKGRKAKVKEKNRGRKRPKTPDKLVQVIQSVYSLSSILKEVVVPKVSMVIKNKQGRGFVLSHGHPWGDPG